MGKNPDHAKEFKGKAKNIPARDMFMLPYQERWVSDPAILTLMEKSRRIGISYGTAYKVVRRHSLNTCRVDTWVSSRDETTARLFVSDCKLFTRRMKIATDDMGMQLIEKESVYSIKFANSTEVNSVASNPDVFAGKGGNVVLDEFALRADPRGVYAIASPTIDWGGSLSIVSTHRGSGNYFNKLIQEIKDKGNPKGFSLHRVTLQDALDQGFLWKLQTKLPDHDPRLQMTEADYFTYQKSRAADQESFLQEYCCIPADDASAFLSYDLIATCELRGPDAMTIETEETIDYARRKGTIRYLRSYPYKDLVDLPCQMYLGVDVGRTKDLTCLWLAGKFAGVLMPLAIVEMQNVEWERQEKEIYALLGLPRMHRGCFDKTGLGSQIGERAQKKFGERRVELIQFSTAVKESLAFPLRSGFEDRSVRVPDDALVTSDLRAIKKETTTAGNIRFGADRSENGHADRFWALALMVHAAQDANAGPTWCASGGSGEGSIVGAGYGAMIPADLDRF